MTETPLPFEWIRIPGGDFISGLSAAQRKLFPLAYDYEEYRQEVVSLPAFYISKYPVTCWQYIQLIRIQDPHRNFGVFSDPSLINHPMMMGFANAEEFCHLINARLPTVMEWEKAARGTDGRLFPWGNEWSVDCGNFGQGDQRGCVDIVRSSPVDAYPEGASPYGVVDVMGNCFEWTSTWSPKHDAYILRGSGRDDAPAAHVVVNYWYHRDGKLGEPVPLGCRPAMDEEQYQNWEGFPVR